MARKNLTAHACSLTLADIALAPLKRTSQGGKETATSLEAARRTALAAQCPNKTALGNHSCRAHRRQKETGSSQLPQVVLKQQLPSHAELQAWPVLPEMPKAAGLAMNKQNR